MWLSFWPNPWCLSLVPLMSCLSFARCRGAPRRPCEARLEGVHRRGKLEFSAVGVLVAILNPLAEAGINILSVSTFDTDYVLVRVTMLEAARAALSKNFALIE